MLKKPFRKVPESCPPPGKKYQSEIKPHSLSKNKFETTNDVAFELNRFDAAVNLAAQISKINLQNFVERLANFHTRHTFSPTLSRVSDWILQQFRNFGYSDVEPHFYFENNLQLSNIVCTKKSANPLAETIILGAHYDCVMQTSGNATARAPGANDNATGVAAVLETARILEKIDLSQTIKFVCFSGEEQGYLGAAAYAEHLKQSNIALRFLLNLDQIGCPSSTGKIIIERDTKSPPSGNNQASEDLAQTIAQFASTKLNIPFSFGSIELSDYMPFEERDYVVVGLYESGNYPAKHSDQDTPEKVDFDYLADMTKVSLGAMFA